MKPPEYRNTYIVQRIIPYRIVSSSSSEQQPVAGLLDVGRVLWVPCDLSPSSPSLVVYAHGIGLLEIERHLLRSIL